MTMQKPPSGTRGAGPPRRLARVVVPVMTRIHRRRGDRVRGLDLLYLTTVGARSGKQRTTPVARFDDGRGGWLVVASDSGAARHPGWYHNIAGHPDHVWVEVAGAHHRVAVQQMEGPARTAAWETVTSRAPFYRKYESKTDRSIPVLRLTPVPD